jgi:stage V sporulation protein SpoVS
MRRYFGQGLASAVRTAGLAAVVALGAPALAQAQSAIIYGSLSRLGWTSR